MDLFESYRRERGEYAVRQFRLAVFNVVGYYRKRNRLPPDMDHEDAIQELMIHLYQKFPLYNPDYRTESGNPVKEITFVMNILRRKMHRLMLDNTRRGFSRIPTVRTESGNRTQVTIDAPAEYSDEHPTSGRLESRGQRADEWPEFLSVEWTPRQWKRVLGRIRDPLNRQAVNLRYRRGHTLQQIANKFRTSHEAARQRVLAGLEDLTTIADYCDPDDFAAVSQRSKRLCYGGA